MESETRRGAREGVAMGVMAGLIFGLFEIVISAAAGNALLAFRMAASVLMGEAALLTASGVVAFLVGLIVHLILSGLFGLVYGAINMRFSRQTQTDWGRGAAIGILFGVALWLVNYHIIARIFYPWFLEIPQLLQLVAHAMFYGLSLGLLFAASERRLHYDLQEAPSHR